MLRVQIENRNGRFPFLNSSWKVVQVIEQQLKKLEGAIWDILIIKCFFLRSIYEAFELLYITN